MNYSEFVTKISSLAPSKEELFEYGMDDSESNEIRELFFFHKKTDQGESQSSSLNCFFDEYTTKGKEVGGIQFLEQVVEFENGFSIFAKLEVELFCLDSQSDEIYLLDESGNTLHFVSKSFDSFLDIIYWSAYFKRYKEKKTTLIVEVIKNLIYEKEDKSNIDFLNHFFKKTTR